jgi:hypothetical protein
VRWRYSDGIEHCDPAIRPLAPNDLKNCSIWYISRNETRACLPYLAIERWFCVPQTKTSVSHRVLLVDDDEAVRSMMTATLEHKGFEVVPAASVVEALKLISTDSFDVLITDLHMPNPSDGFAVVTAMRHSQRMPLRCWSAATRM